MNYNDSMNFLLLVVLGKVNKSISALLLDLENRISIFQLRCCILCEYIWIFQHYLKSC